MRPCGTGGREEGKEGVRGDERVKDKQTVREIFNVQCYYIQYACHSWICSRLVGPFYHKQADFGAKVGRGGLIPGDEDRCFILGACLLGIDPRTLRPSGALIVGIP